MNRITRIAAVGAIALLTAVAGWACNDDGDDLTLEEYFQRVDEIDNDSNQRIDAVFNGITDENDVEQFRAAFKEFAPLLQDAADDFDGIDPPGDAEAEHNTMADALNDFAAKANDIADDADDIEASTPDEFFAAVDEQGFTEAEEKFDTACQDLLQVAADNSIQVEIDCGEGDQASEEIEQTMRDAMAAWNGRNADTFLSFFTDNAISEIFGQGEPITRADAEAALPNFIGDPPLELHELTAESDGDTGSATVLWNSEPFLEHIRFAMIQQDGAWKIDSQDYIDIEDVPADTTMIHVDVNEFAFGVADSDLVTANEQGLIGFEISNVGEQEHHFGLFRLPAEGDAQELLAAEEEVPGLDVAGFTDPIAPGETNRAWVFIEPLDPGRYAMVCFLPDTAEGAEGTPHAFKGMVHEFTIPETSASIAPANMLPRV